MISFSCFEFLLLFCTEFTCTCIEGIHAMSCTCNIFSSMKPYVFDLVTASKSYLKI